MVIIGNILLVLSVWFTAQLTAVMIRRIRSVAAAGLYRRVLLWEMSLCAGFILLALAVRFDFFSPVRPLPVRIVSWCAAAGSLATAAIAAVTVAGGLGRDPGEAKVLIVPGLALEHGRPARGLRSRLLTAAGYTRAHPDCTVIVSGGNETDASPAEAAVMREILLSEGVDPERIVTEDRAADTRENFLFAAALTDPDEPAGVVTDVFHMRRAVRQARRAGFSHILKLPAAPDPGNWCADLMWEIIAEIDRLVKGK